MKRAVVYVRYSSDAQSSASIEDQLRLCRERISREGWSLKHVYKDAAMSAASALRPGYQALLASTRLAEFDVIVAEALDRLSRDQADVALLFRHCRFAGVRIFTLAEGDIDELHIGFKGTMNAVALRDLADKTRRGLRGRVEAGASGGGLSYGYDVVPSLENRGARQINETEKEVVIFIFTAFRDGKSPKRIALELNDKRIAGPQGGKWSASTINGNRDRGTGILNNELYIGRLVWNRLRYSKDPDKGSRRSRPNDPAQHVVTKVPHLRIVDDELWAAVRERQARVSHRHKPASDDAAPDASQPFWSKQRPRYLFSGLMKCGTCGGGFSKISKEHFGCSTARNKGPTACPNLLTIRRDRLEETVLDGLRNRLMDPALYQDFASAFTTEWNKQQAETTGDASARQAELTRVKVHLEKLVDAICTGTPVASIHDRMQVLEARRLVLEAELASAVAPAPLLHPNLAVLYRERVAALTEALDDEDGAAARDLVRSLVDEVRLIPESGALRIELRGELAAILGFAGPAGGDGSSASGAPLDVQVKLVAGTGFEPVTFRL